ncbi:hypothetical protein CANCADRAFT_103067 [Tortispora caseinolytica NRRL Y-17796]|uniref:UBC core domain-containing protein n=1 Tax=Tortispora caseinolytica NRRL Y-17796 TaxID=767744 RepID=A0A1E4TEV4_9ASCO|nr:hypothetical protein CANCADRAFT_103067 [Tortispora caseinolytica NRRL Y-17796]
MAGSVSGALLRRQFQDLNKNGIPGISAGLRKDNLYDWEVLMVGPEDTVYEGGLFRARMRFPSDYPNMPPVLKFISPMWHPNVFPDGVVCISILHSPGEDEHGLEDAGERWLPVHTAETILLSVMAMLSSPNLDSPANVDATKQYRDDYQAYKKRVREIVRRSVEDLPE